MALDTSAFNIARIRELLTRSFTPTDLRRFCLDRPVFRPIVDRFGPGYGLDDMVDEVIDYCRTKVLWDELLTEVEQENPRQYARFAGDLRVTRPPTRVMPFPHTWPRWLWIAGALLLALVVIWSISLWMSSGTPTPTPVPPVVESSSVPAASQAAYTWTRPIDGMVMVYVEAGEFLMGSTDLDRDAYGDEKPQHPVHLDAFWIDRTEVTNAQYLKCVEAGACEEPRCWNDDIYGAPEQPVVCVTWYDAQAYAAWVGGRLPTEAEWEKAARGVDGRIYPWGNSAPDCTKVNYKACEMHTTAVGSYPRGASPYGVLDMAGNVWEWVADRHDEEYYARAPTHNPLGPDLGTFRGLRGGAFHNSTWNLRCANRYGENPDDWLDDRGFRVVAASSTPSGP